MYNTKQPIPGIPIVEPEVIPGPGDKLIGYEQIPSDNSCFISPRPTHMKTRGWISVVLLTIFMWPAAILPCFMSCSYYQMQRPVYTNAKGVPSEYFSNIMETIDGESKVK